MKCIFIGGVLLDGSENMEPQTGKAIVTENGKITEIADAGTVNTDGATVVDLGGKYIMPGLINLHVHIPADGIPKKKATDPKDRVKKITGNPLLRAAGKMLCQNYAKTELMSGVTTIRAVGGVLDWDAVVRDKIKAGKADGPRILAANEAISVPGGHMAGSLACEATDAQMAEDLVKQIAKGKPDLIKLMITGGVLDATKKGEPGVLRMPSDYVKAACTQAHKLGYHVAAHVESPEGVRVALENGVDTIEHGAEPDDEILRLFKEKHAALVTTLSPALPYALFDRSVSGASEISQYNGKIVFQGIIDCAEKCLAAGVPVGLGTDTGCDYVTHYNMWMELQLFHKYCGVSNAFALHTATERNAQIAGIADKTGTIGVGKDADLIVTEDNPLEHLSALKDVCMVMANGKLYRNPRVKKNEQVETEMAKFLVD